VKAEMFLLLRPLQETECGCHQEPKIGEELGVS